MYRFSFVLGFISTLFGSIYGQNCPPEGIAYFPLEDCSKYKLCVNGDSSEVQCPGGLYFNPDMNNCDLPQNVPECIGGKRNVLTQCGQTINAYSGAIEYKLNETYDAQELCVFILRHNYSTNPGFRFVLESHGISNVDENSIVIYSLRKLHYPGFIFSSNVLGPPSLVPVLNVPGFVAVVIFKSYSNTGTGFKLKFKATGDPGPTPGYNTGFNFVFNAELENPKQFLSSASCFDERCLDVFAVTDESKMITDPALQLNLTLTLDPMPVAADKTCFQIYSFEYREFRFVSNQFNSCWANNGTVMQFDYKTRGMLIGLITSFPGNEARGNLYLKKDADPEHI